MTSHQAQLQTLITEIESLLIKATPRLPWAVAGETSQQRKLLEQALAYLRELQEPETLSSGVTTPGNAEIMPQTETAEATASNIEATSQQVLQALLQEMQYLRAQTIQPLTHEIEALQQEREKLKDEVRQLERDRSDLTEEGPPQLSPDWMSEVADQLQSSLMAQLTPQIKSLQPRIDDTASLSATPQTPQEIAADLPQLHPQQRLEQLRQIQSQTDYLLLKLDSNLRAIFESMEQSIRSYCESLNQGLEDMHGLGQQGEVVFRAFINHIAQQLSQESNYLTRSEEEMARLPEGEETAYRTHEEPPLETDDLPTREPVIDPIVSLDEVDLDTEDIQTGEEITLFQLDEEITQLQLEDDEDADETDSSAIGENVTAYEEAEEESTIIQTEPIPWDVLTGRRNGDFSTTETETDTTEASLDSGDIALEYTDEINSLYVSLFGDSTEVAEDESPEAIADQAPELNRVALEMDETSDESDETVIPSEVTSDVTEDTLDETLLNTRSSAPALDVSEEFETAADLEEQVQSVSLEEDEAIASPVSDSAETSLENLLEPAAEEPTTTEQDEELDIREDAESATSWETFLGSEVAQELAPATTSSIESDTITSLSDLLPALEDSEAQNSTDPLALEEASEDTFIPAPPDEDLLASEEATESAWDIDLSLDEVALEQLTRDLSSLEGLSTESLETAGSVNLDESLEENENTEEVAAFSEDLSASVPELELTETDTSPLEDEESSAEVDLSLEEITGDFTDETDESDTSSLDDSFDDLSVEVADSDSFSGDDGSLEEEPFTETSLSFEEITRDFTDEADDSGASNVEDSFDDLPAEVDLPVEVDLPAEVFDSEFLGDEASPLEDQISATENSLSFEEMSEALTDETDESDEALFSFDTADISSNQGDAEDAPDGSTTLDAPPSASDLEVITTDRVESSSEMSPEGSTEISEEAFSFSEEFSSDLDLSEFEEIDFSLELIDETSEETETAIADELVDLSVDGIEAEDSIETEPTVAEDSSETDSFETPLDLSLSLDDISLQLDLPEGTEISTFSVSENSITPTAPIDDLSEADISDEARLHPERSTPVTETRLTDEETLAARDTSVPDEMELDLSDVIFEDAGTRDDETFAEEAFSLGDIELNLSLDSEPEIGDLDLESSPTDFSEREFSEREIEISETESEYRSRELDTVAETENQALFSDEGVDFPVEQDFPEADLENSLSGGPDTSEADFSDNIASQVPSPEDSLEENTSQQEERRQSLSDEDESANLFQPTVLPFDANLDLTLPDIPDFDDDEVLPPGHRPDAQSSYEDSINAQENIFESTTDQPGASGLNLTGSAETGFSIDWEETTSNFSPESVLADLVENENLSDADDETLKGPETEATSSTLETPQEAETTDLSEETLGALSEDELAELFPPTVVGGEDSLDDVDSVGANSQNRVETSEMIEPETDAESETPDWEAVEADFRINNNLDSSTDLFQEEEADTDDLSASANFEIDEVANTAAKGDRRSSTQDEADRSESHLLADLDLFMEEIPESEIESDEAFRSAFEGSFSSESSERADASMSETLGTDYDLDSLLDIGEEDEVTEVLPPQEETPRSQAGLSLQEDTVSFEEMSSPEAVSARHEPPKAPVIPSTEAEAAVIDESLPTAGVLATLGEEDSVSDDVFPVSPTDSEEEWFLGLDVGTSGLSAVLMNRVNGSAHPLYWSERGADTAASATFRLPMVAALRVNPRTADSSWQLQAVGTGAFAERATDSEGCLLNTLKPLLKMGIPYTTASDTWEPIIQWSHDQAVPLQQVLSAVQALVSLVKQSTGTRVELGAVGLETPQLRPALENLQGVIVGHPSHWSDTYRINIREAILAARLVEDPGQVFFLEEAIATILSGLPDPNTPLDPGNQSQTLYQCDWQGGTVIISAGASCTELGIVDLPHPLDTLSREDFTLRNFPYGGDALDLDIICQLLLPPERRNPRMSGDRSQTMGPEWDWQAFLPEGAQWANLELESLELPQLAEPDQATRIRMRQHLEASKLGQSLLEATRYLKLILQNQGQFQIDLADQSWRIYRRDLESRVLVPYIQRLNQHLNGLLSTTGLSSQGINQVICTGGNASFAMIAKWLRQKFPNATIIQDTYPGNRPPSCSRVAYGLVNLCRYPQVLDVPRHQYSDYFLLRELVQAIPDQPLPLNGILHLLEERGVNVDACESRIVAILEGHLPPGLIPNAIAKGYLSQATLDQDIYQHLETDTLFTRQSGQIYMLNPQQRDRLQSHLTVLLANKRQSLADPLIAQLVVP